MSRMIAEARGRTQGAGPAGMNQGGFFDFVKGAVGLIPGVGGIASAGLGLLSGGGSDPRIPSLPTFSGGGTAVEIRRAKSLARQARRAGPIVGSGQVLTDQTAVLACPGGFHPNKSSYYMTSPAGTPIFVPRGHKCVKNRKRNPLNPRALSNSMARINQAKLKVGPMLGRITIRKKTCPN